MTTYDPTALASTINRGRLLIQAIENVEALGPDSLNDAIGLLISCIAGTYRNEADIRYVFDNQRSTYDLNVCSWLLDRFEGSDPAKDLWTRDTDGRYSLLNSAPRKPAS